MRLFDSHAHLASERFEADFPQILERMRQGGVAGCMVICDPGDPEPDHVRALEIVRQNPGFWLAAACHPQNALHFSDETEATVRRLAALPCVSCIGETGLDYYDNQSSRAQQIDALERQLDIAFELNLPVQLHIRNAHGDMIRILQSRQARGRLPRGVVHCFTRSWELAKVYLRLGYYLSLSGTVTYANANRLLETARRIPADRLLIETDAPWVAPEPYRGGRGEPAYLEKTFLKIAQLRGADPQALAEHLWENAGRALR